MTQDELGEFLKNAIEESQRLTAHLPKPIAGIYVSSEGKAIDISINSAATVSEWIKGEGADISLHRDQETGKVAGAHLPLYAKTLIIGGDRLPTITIDLDSGRVEVDRDDAA